MHNYKSYGVYINYVFRILISFSLILYARGYVFEGRKFPKSSHMIDWWSYGYFTSLTDISNAFLVKRHEKEKANIIMKEDFQRIFQETIRNIEYTDFSERVGAFVVIECLNQTASDELAKRIASNTSATFLQHPTDSIKPLLMQVQKIPKLTYGLETLSHYDMALRVRNEVFEKSVIIGRYWYHSAMLAIGRAMLYRRAIPGHTHNIYRWPPDLMVPDVVFFLKYPIYPITDNMTAEKKKDHIDIGSRAIKALLRFTQPAVIDLYGDNVYGEIDPYEKAMEILRTRRN